jgi:hypothetical protein
MYVHCSVEPGLQSEAASSSAPASSLPPSSSSSCLLACLLLSAEKKRKQAAVTPRQFRLCELCVARAKKTSEKSILKDKKICAVRESNPKLNLGRVSCYHYTNGAGDDDAAFLRNRY